MRDADFYPPGAAHDPNAPYNQVEPPEIEVEITVSITLERDCTITTDEVYWDGDDWVILEDADKFKAYDYDYASIPEMLSELVKYIDGEMSVLKKSIKDRTASATEHERYQQLQRMRESAVGWEVTDGDIEVL